MTCVINLSFHQHATGSIAAVLNDAKRKKRAEPTPLSKAVNTAKEKATPVLKNIKVA